MPIKFSLLTCILSCELDITISILQMRQLRLRSHTFSKQIWNLNPHLTLKLNHVRTVSAVKPASSLTFTQCPNPRSSWFRIHVLSFTSLLTATRLAQVLTMVHVDFNTGFSPPLLLSLSSLPILLLHPQGLPTYYWEEATSFSWHPSTSALWSHQPYSTDPFQNETMSYLHNAWHSHGCWFNMLFFTHLRPS